MPDVGASASKPTQYEIIDSGNGEKTQTRYLPGIHVFNTIVWVNEGSALSERERAELEAQKIVDKKTDLQGKILAFWVRWKEVENFGGSHQDDRHFTMDRATGTLRFGDGIHGRIIPDDANNIRIILIPGKEDAPNIFADDIPLSPEGKKQLFELCYLIKNQGFIHSGRKGKNRLQPGKGLHLLLSGPSSPAKARAAGIIAHEAGLDLYRVDLSSLVSTSVSETEKNLNRIFAEAKTSNAILFFDEADALFGKKTTVRDAHDRYADGEVHHLLRKMEEYEGIVILAGDVSRKTDDAFPCRVDFSVVFTE